MINVGPFLFISILGIVFWVQEGRVSQGYFFSMAYLGLSFFVISDLLYIPYLVFLFKGLSFNTHELISNRISFYLIRGFEAKDYNNIIFL